MRNGKDRRRFNPKVGEIYENAGGGTFKCLDLIDDFVKDNIALMQNEKSRWTFKAHGCGIYPDGKIDWDFSTNGHFE